MTKMLTVTKRQYEAIEQKKGKESIGWKDLPIRERLKFMFFASMPMIQLRSKVENGRIESVEHYYEVKRKMRKW